MPPRVPGIRRLARGFLVRLSWRVLCVGAAPVALLSAQEMEIPVAIQIPLFIKVIAFDRHIEINTATDVVFVIAFQSGHRRSAETKDEVARVLAELPVDDRRTIRVVTVDLDREDLRTVLRDQRATLLYITPLRGLALSAITTVTRGVQVTTFTGVPKYVDQGLAVGVRRVGDKPKLLVNLRVARLEGADFSAEFLKLVQLVH
jgi:hypothetical protein